MNKRPFAVFDIDGTFIRWQIFHAIVNALGVHGHLPDGSHEAIKSARMVWKNRRSTNSFHEYETVLLEIYLAALPKIRQSDYQKVVDQVFDEYKDQTFTFTRNLLKKLQAEGYATFAISGSHQDAVDRLARYHGFDAAIGAQFEIKNGKFTGECTTPIFDKKAALEQLVESYDCTYEESYAVGDSLSDSSMLQVASHPIAFNPDDKLLSVARKNLWQIVVERKNVVYELNSTEQGYLLSTE